VDQNDAPPPPPIAPTAAPGPRPAGNFPWLTAIRQRIVSGLVMALPIAITLWIVYWLYSTLQNILLDPGARIVKRLIGRERLASLPWWWQEYVSPLIAVILALTFLYFLGLFVRSRLHRTLDWIMMRVPIVTVIYKAVRNVFASLSDQQSGGKFKRVVLVPFPSKEVRSPAFVTRSVRDEATGRVVLCVYVPYCPLPTAGLLLTVPEEEVTELNWDVNEAMQAIISFGLSTPGTITFHPRPPGPLPPGGLGPPPEVSHGRAPSP
jgi:uncharacterized membrane protein